jgi:hypothetical protein
MAASNDDIDDILRAAMKTLDAEIPSGYFEGLPNRTLARLEGSMQTTSGTESSNSEMPMTDGTGKDRDEDSGLHDIRNLASSQRQRLSSRRLGTNPPPVDEDILASTSGSWKSIALPEPAKMVALPDIADLPSKADLKAQQKAEKVAAKSRRSRPSGEIKSEIKNDELPMAAAPSASSSLPSIPVASSSLGGGGLAVVPVSAKVTDAPIHLEEEIPSLALGTAKGAEMAAGTAKGATAAVIAPAFGSRISGVQAQPKKSRGALIGVIGLGLAAAAGVIIYVATRDKGADTTTAASNAPVDLGARAKDAEPAKPAAVPAPEQPAAAPADEPKVDDAKAIAPDPVPVEPKPAPVKGKPTPTKKPVGKAVIEVDDPGNGVKAKKDEPKPDKKEPPKEGDPDFEQLLKDSGYQKKDADKPKLEKKSLSGGDFKTGMAGVAGRAQGCYKGTQGTASVKLTIAPSGQVTKVAVTGVGAAEASCVEAAVRGATFPAWDGGPQSFGYSYLLSE